jgi:serine/threonine-protein kinase
MSPEQADGRLEEVDERTDVYGLGAALFEMLTYHPPFEGTRAIEVIQKVLLSEPSSPRKSNPAVDRDLDTICLACLAKEPSRRYASCKALAEDLGRYLEGLPIEARPIPSWMKIWKRVRRNRLASAALTLLVLVLVAAATVGGLSWKRWLERETELGLELDSKDKVIANSESIKDLAIKERDLAKTDRERNEAVSRVLFTAHQKLAGSHRTLKAAYHDFTSSDDVRSKALESVRDDLQSFCRNAPRDPASQATMLAVQGWFVLLGGDPDGGFGLLTRAKEIDPDVAWSHLFEAMAYLFILLRGAHLPNIVMSQDGVNFSEAPPPSELYMRNKKNFDRCISALMQSRLLCGAAKSEFKAVVEGLEGVVEGDAKKTVDGMTRALAMGELAWLEEEFLTARARARYRQFRFESALTDVGKVLEKHPRDLAANTIRALTLAGRGCTLQSSGGDPRDLYRMSISACDSILENDPSRTGAFNMRGDFKRLLGEAEEVFDADPRDSYRGAIADFEISLKNVPGEPLVASNLGIAYARLAAATEHFGGDGERLYALSLKAHDSAVEAAPKKAIVFNNRATAFISRGKASAARGGAAVRDFEAASADLEKALQLDPTHSSARLNRGLAALGLASEYNDDPEKSQRFVKASIEMFTTLLAVNPKSITALINRGAALMTLGDIQERRGDSGEKNYGEARNAFDKVLSARPSMSQVVMNRGLSYKKLAQARYARGEDTRAFIEAAVRDFTAVLGRDPENGEGRKHRSEVLGILGAVEMKEGRDPRSTFRAALKDLKISVNTESGNPQILNRLGLAYRNLAEAEDAWQGEGGEHFEKSLASFDGALEEAPNFWPAHANKARVLVSLGRFFEARTAFGHALGLPGADTRGLKPETDWVDEVLALPQWHRECLAGGIAIARGAYASARSWYEKGLPGAERKGAYGVPEARETLMLAHFNLGCILSQASSGKCTPKAISVTLEAGQSTFLKNEAVSNLRSARDLGWEDTDYVQGEKDFAPLHGFPAFESLLQEWKRGPKKE